MFFNFDVDEVFINIVVMFFEILVVDFFFIVIFVFEGSNELYSFVEVIFDVLFVVGGLVFGLDGIIFMVVFEN